MMTISRCRVICFSPTGSTRKIAETVAAGTNLPFEVTDITKPEVRANPLPAPETGELTIIAVPVYYGRVAKTAAKTLSRLKGQTSPVVLIVNYGNRHYDDALLELLYLARGSVFSPVAAAAFASEHSYSTQEYPLAPGRPDASDLERATAFGQKLGEKISSGTLGKLKQVPGKAPYCTYPDMHRAPVSTGDCTLCGTCVAACPVAAITIEDSILSTNEQDCIICQACVKICPECARMDNGQGAIESRQRLTPLIAERKEPEIFF